jgi:cell division protein FtsW (lipid II flippase)
VLVPLVGITFFAIFVGIAVALRRKAQLHKRFMMLAMITVLGPPVARLIQQADFGAHVLAIQTAVATVFVIGCMINDWVKHRVVHPVYLYGGLILVASWPLRFMIARTAAWEHVGQWLAGM